MPMLLCSVSAPIAMRKDDEPWLVGSPDRLRSELGWQPSIGLEDGVRAAVAALRRRQAAGTVGVITVSLIGGLGNQMFQYAAGKALAERHGVPLALDISGFRNYALRAVPARSFAGAGSHRLRRRPSPPRSPK